MDYNYKVEIELDDEKIREDVEQEDGVERVHEWVKENFRDNGFIDISEDDKTIVFCDKSDKHDYAKMLNIIIGMYDDEFFRTHLKKYLWYNYDYAEKKDIESGRNYHIENIIYELDDYENNGV